MGDDSSATFSKSMSKQDSAPGRMGDDSSATSGKSMSKQDSVPGRMDDGSSITCIKGIGDKTKEAFEKMGIYTIGDILLHFPRNYIRYPAPEELADFHFRENVPTAIKARVRRAPKLLRTGKLSVTVLVLEQGEKKLKLVWFRMPYISKSLRVGTEVVFYGRITQNRELYQMDQPAVFSVDTYSMQQERLLPVYSLSAGITNNRMMKAVLQVFLSNGGCAEFLPEEILLKRKLEGYQKAVREMHFPEGNIQLTEARRRLVYNEFFLFILRMQHRKARQEKILNPFPMETHTKADDIIRRLPFALTNAQQKAIREIQKDMSGPYAMQRLLQGDVGSGKTLVAFFSMLTVHQHGYQSAIMAPTEVLAKQHYDTFSQLSNEYGLSLPLILLTGSMKQRERKEAYEEMAKNPDAMIIGTHTLFQENLVFGRLALVVTDEQHRFGVKQRERFSAKGEHPHILIMSATPIPRTLAMILYGNMDASVIDELPQKRLRIKNCVVDTSCRKKAYSFLLGQIQAGHQGYIICPLVDETEQNPLMENVMDYVVKIREYFPPEVRIGTLHGKMKGKDKTEVMERFARNEIQLLVATTVIEVGINVPNSTVMMIENADHFGLAQLHQLRGRVGRGDAQSYCIMINTSDSRQAGQRLEILNRSEDGFLIASEDLKLRGPGDFFGIRQSGEFGFQIADIYQDALVLQDAADDAGELLLRDPELKAPEYAGLREMLRKHTEGEDASLSL